MTTITNRRRGQGGGLRTVLVVILCLVGIGILVVWRGPLTGLFWTVIGPVINTTQALTTGSELERLRNQLAVAEALVADRDVLLRENLSLKSRLGRVPADTETLLATVLVRPPATPYDTLVLDVGLRQGVSQGDLVFAGGAVVIGRITEVYRGTSRATLYSAPSESHEGILLTKGGSVPVVIEGQGGFSLKGQLPQGVDVQIGDAVLFPDLNPMLAAKVSAMETAPGETFLTVFMQMPVNPAMLHSVEVRKPYLQ